MIIIYLFGVRQAIFFSSRRKKMLAEDLIAERIAKNSEYLDNRFNDKDDCIVVSGCVSVDYTIFGGGGKS